MSDRSSAEEEATRLMIREQCFRAWEAGHGVMAALESLREVGVAVARTTGAADSDPDLRALLVRYGAASSEQQRLAGHLDTLHDTLRGVCVVLRVEDL